MSTTTSIRSINRNDIEILVRLEEEFVQYLNSLKKGRNKISPMTREVFLRDAFGDNPAFSGILAELDGKPLGYLLYHQGYNTEFAARTIQVIDLFVRNTIRQTGVGTLLMKTLIPIAKKTGASMICTSVWNLNKDARNFYIKLGGEMIDEEIVWWTQEKWL